MINMAGSVNSDNCDIEDKEYVWPQNAGLSTSFTISFEDDDDNITLKSKKIIKSSNMFVRKHVRTLSLPFSNDYQFVKSDSDNVDQKYFQCVNSATMEPVNGTTSSSCKENFLDQNQSVKSTKSEDHAPENDDKCNEVVSDSGSEGGTYTLEKDNKQVQLARKSIDQVFGICSNEQNGHEDVEIRNKIQSKTSMIDEWMERSASAIKSANDGLETTSVSINCYIKNNKPYISKIPSPVVTRRELNLSTSSPVKRNVITSSDTRKYHNGTEIKPEKQPNTTNKCEIDTKCYLEETENIVTALQNRLHSNIKTDSRGVVKKQMDEREKETAYNKYSNTRFNRAFSLRRDRVKKCAPVMSTTAIPIRTKNLIPVNSSKNENDVYPHANDGNITTTETVKIKKSWSSTAPPAKYGRQLKKIEDNLNKKTCLRLKSNGSGVRSNSSLSAQEIEFQNWKRRKSYDPLKAAAEDKKKKSTTPSAATTGSVSTIVLNKKKQSAEPKEESEKNEKGIMRSASFHGLRNKNGMDRSLLSDEDRMNRSTSSRYILTSLSNDDSISSDIADDDDEDEWIVPKPPSSSLQNTPPESVGSRLSLLSNAASNSSPLLPVSPVIKVNLTTLLNVTQLSQTIKTTISTLTDSLRETNENGEQGNQFNFQNDNCLSTTHSTDEDIEPNGFNDTVENDDVHNSEKKKDEEDKSVLVEDNGDCKYNEIIVDHQLRITLDNLRQIYVAVQELQFVCSNK